MITKEYLNKIFEYKNGFLIWKIARGPVKIGRIAGTLNSRGYIHIRVDMNFYQAHRLIWIYFNGDIPTGLTIDHINRDRADNRIENLRLATSSENNKNSIQSDHHNAGVWQTKSGKFKASYRNEGQRYYLGTFETEEEAIKVRKNFLKSANSLVG